MSERKPYRLQVIEVDNSGLFPNIIQWKLLESYTPAAGEHLSFEVSKGVKVGDVIDVYITENPPSF